MAQIVKLTARVKIMNPSYSYRRPLLHVPEKILRRTLQMRLINPRGDYLTETIDGESPPEEEDS